MSVTRGWISVLHIKQWIFRAMLQLTVVRTNYLCCKVDQNLSLCVQLLMVCLLRLLRSPVSLSHDGTTANPRSLFNDTARIVQLVYSILAN